MKLQRSIGLTAAVQSSALQKGPNLGLDELPLERLEEPRRLVLIVRICFLFQK